nr:hypothetical protein [Planctomycetota bacterium]
MSTPVTVTCPECGAKLKLKSRESLGRKLPCPKCEVPFVLTEGSKGSQQVRKGSFAENNRPLLIGLAAGGLVAVGMLVASLVLPRGGDPAPQPGETVADQNDSTPGTSPPTGETPRRTDSANARQNGFDLLAMANVSRDAQGGEWTRNGAAIVSRGGTAILQLPIEPAGDYRADVT